MGSEAGDFSQLTLKHGCKCMPEATVSVEDCLIAVSEAVGGANIRSASRMNKAIEFFLSESQIVNDLIETGLVIKDIFVPVLPLSSPAKKVILSNVPPFVKNEKLQQILQMYGKIVSSIKMTPLGCKNPDIKHVMSFRRQVFMILNSQSDPLNLSVKLSIDGKDYTIFISSESMRCFVCGEFGHVRQTCPRRDRPTGLLAAPAADAENSVRAAGEDIVATAEASEPQPGEAFSAPGDVPEGRPVLEASGDGLAGAVEEAAGPSHIPAVSQAETSPRPVCLQSVTETDLIEGNQKQTDKIVNDAIIDNSFKQSQDDLLSQESVDLMDDSGNEHEDTEIMDNDAMDSELVTGVGDLSCPVCIELFSDPVLLSCGHSFCRRCIKDHWTSSNSRRCYVCRQVSPLPPVSNLSLRNACDSYLREQNTRIDGGLKCQIHREVIVLFCQTDGKAICATCKKHEHEWHVTLPLQQTVRQRKGKLKEALRSAEKTLLTLQNGTSRDSKISRYIKSQSQMTERRIRMEFEKLHQFLRKEEESRIAALNEEEKEKEDIIERQIQGGILSLSDRVKELEERIEDDDITLLKNYDGTMNRAKYTLPDEVALIDVPKHLGNLKYQVWEKMKDSCPYYPVILNPNTSSPNVVSVSDDLTSVTSCFRQQDETNAPPLHRNRVVLGSVGYADGVHTWDIEVGNSRHWTLGVCFGSVERSVVQPLTPKNGFWGLRCDGDSYRLMTAGMSRLNVKRNPEVVRVKIEYYSEDHNEFFLIFRKQKRWRKVSFSDARSDSFLAGFTRVPLENELFPFVIPEDQSVPLRVVPAKVIVTVEQKLSFTERHRVLILICGVFVIVIVMILSWKKEQMNV